MTPASTAETATVVPSEDDAGGPGSDAPAATVPAPAEAATAGDTARVTAVAAADGGNEAASTDVVQDEDTEGVDADEVVAGAVAAEAVEIPKQQSAEAAADNEAGEGARR
ncbi:hypothetical protein [Streptomyces sp. NPDC002057]|uniref:hypothetical protein n=1 Tax=Streptomyces sp. NPDC002057 TaxID=3154664 RepID=UPI003334333B